MDLIGVGGLILSAIGVLLSVWALAKANSAKVAVNKVIEKNSDQFARDAARNLLAKLTDARDAAMAQRRGASRLSSAGRHPDSDHKAIELAQDALATVTIDSSQQLVARMRTAATELNQALQTIASNSGRDGWADALGVLQGIIPEVDALQQGLSATALR